jgi:hypothetical protein
MQFKCSRCTVRLFRLCSEDEDDKEPAVVRHKESGSLVPCLGLFRPYLSWWRGYSWAASLSKFRHFISPNPLSRIFRNMIWTSTWQQDKTVGGVGWIYLSWPIVKLYCHMIPEPAGVAPKHVSWKIVERDNCFVGNLFRSGSRQKRCDLKQ